MDLIPFCLTLDIPKVLETKNAEKSSVNMFERSDLFDYSETKKHKEIYKKLISIANSYVEIAAYGSLAGLEGKSAIYCCSPTHSIKNDNKLISEFYLYLSNDFESDFHDLQISGPKSKLTSNVNLTKFFGKIVN